MQVDRDKSRSADVVEYRLSQVGGELPAREVLTDWSIVVRAIVAGIMLGVGVGFVTLALDATATVSVTLWLGLAVGYVYVALRLVDGLACVVSDRWTCHDCRGETARWSADDSVDVDVEDEHDREGAL